MVTLAEERLARNRKSVFAAAPLPQTLASVASTSRRSCAAPAPMKDAKSEGAWRRLVLDFRTNDAILDYVNGAEVARYAQHGVVDAGPHDPHQEHARWSCRRPMRATRRLPRGGARGGRRISSPPITPISKRNNARAGAGQARTRSAAARRRWCRASACSAWGAARRTRRSPPTSPRIRCRRSPTPKRSAASSRCPKPSCSRWNTGRWSRPSLAASAEKPLAGQVVAITGGAGAIGAATAPSSSR